MSENFTAGASARRTSHIPSAGGEFVPPAAPRRPPLPDVLGVTAPYAGTARRGTDRSDAVRPDAARRDAARREAAWRDAATPDRVADVIAGLHGDSIEPTAPPRKLGAESVVLVVAIVLAVGGWSAFAIAALAASTGS